MWCFTNQHRCGCFTRHAWWQLQVSSFCVPIVDQDRTQVRNDWQGDIVHCVGMKWFHVYLYERGFTLITDHKPLIAVFHPEKGVPAMSVARLQRYALFLAGFDYKIEYQSRTKHCNAISYKLFLKMLDSTTHNLTEFSLNRLQELRRAICFLFKQLKYFFASVQF